MSKNVKANENQTEKEFNKLFNLNDIYYNLKLKLTKSTIIITLNSKDDFMSLYDHSAEISYSEFLNLGKCFKSCSNHLLKM